MYLSIKYLLESVSMYFCTKYRETSKYVFGSLELWQNIPYVLVSLVCYLCIGYVSQLKDSNTITMDTEPAEA